MNIKALIASVVTGAVVITSQSAHALSVSQTEPYSVEPKSAGVFLNLSAQALSSYQTSSINVIGAATTPNALEDDVILGLAVMAGLFAASRRLNAQQDSEK